MKSMGLVEEYNFAQDWTVSYLPIDIIFFVIKRKIDSKGSDIELYTHIFSALPFDMKEVSLQSHV